ncbi:hypothetical protein ACILDS_09955 [Capnocytophaga canis]|uniref:hypothetical protein n=1 Tax=Capnocytophaga canis TaxID=1848903 RepID=UPI0037D7568E
MNKLTIGKQKVVNASKILFFTFLGIHFYVLPQETIEGVFYVTEAEGEFGYMYKFSKNGTFEYTYSGDVAVINYGKGHYSFVKDSLILNFDLTELTESTYHKYTFYENYKDSIEIKFRIITVDNGIAKELNVGSSTDRVGLILGNSNSGAIKLKRENNYKKIFFSSIEYNRYDVQIYGAYNYNIDVYLKKTSTYGEAIPIKFVTKKYKILKNKKDYLELQPPNGTILKLKKVEKGFYSDDPFE